jgi:hypothetical protein
MTASIYLDFVLFSGLFVLVCCILSLLAPSKRGQALFRLN